MARGNFSKDALTRGFMERAAGSTETVSRFLRRRLEETAGILLFALGLAFLVALASLLYLAYKQVWRGESH